MLTMCRICGLPVEVDPITHEWRHCEGGRVGVRCSDCGTYWAKPWVFCPLCGSADIYPDHLAVALEEERNGEEAR
ncbi:hypothetical protein [Thermogutta sp.]|uniref:hypothetical protein n=1 Tax=Thermogutta sp. TaxID=1962930 RepID=UPI00321F675D